MKYFASLLAGAVVAVALTSISSPPARPWAFFGTLAFWVTCLAFDSSMGPREGDKK